MRAWIAFEETQNYDSALIPENGAESASTKVRLLNAVSHRIRKHRGGWEEGGYVTLESSLESD